MKIAIFGGSFNPVHREHINIAQAALKGLSLDRLYIMPSHITPYKTGKMLASAQDRLNMCRLAFKDTQGVEVSDYEICQGGVSYTYLTCRAFRQKYPEATIYFIVGGDSLAAFSGWKLPEEILQNVTLAVCARQDSNKLENDIASFKAQFNCDIVQFEYVGGDVSSTTVRTLCALGEDVQKYVPDSVVRYILQNSLYKIEGADKVKASMSEHRWRHTVGVALMAARHCSRVNVPEKDAITAATFHDCAKEMRPDSDFFANFELPDDVPPPVVHQYTGAYLAEKRYKITDEGILNAIRYHCSGRPNMSAFEKLIYLSDLLEEGRTYSEAEELRRIFYRDIDEAMYVSVERQLQYLKKSDAPIYQLTNQLYESLKEERK